MRAARIIAGYAASLTVFGAAIPTGVITFGRAVDHALGWRRVPLWPVNVAAAALLGGVGVCWMAWSWWFLLTRGRGHPSEAFGIEVSPVTQQLVTSGPYGRTRNPMVFGYFLVLLALAAYFGSAGMLVAVGLVAALGWVNIVFFEEPRLERRFGEAYREYRRAVPRFMPLCRRRRGSAP